MSFSGKVCLKKKKNGLIQNSTNTVGINSDVSENFGIGYSYNENIMLIDHSRKIIIFNVRKFSPTTTNHLSALQYKSEKLLDLSGYTSYRIEATSLNGITNGEDLLSDIKTKKLFSTNGLRPLLVALKFKVKEIDQLVSEAEKNRKDEEEGKRKRKNSMAKESSLKRKISNLDYASVKAFRLAIAKYKEVSHGYLGVYFSDESKIFLLGDVLFEEKGKTFPDNLSLYKILEKKKHLEIFGDLGEEKQSEAV